MGGVFMEERVDGWYSDPEGGWTFIETLIVIGIVLILTTSVGFMAVKYLDKARVVSARSQVETFSLSLDAYFIDCGMYPASQDGLFALWTRPNREPEASAWRGPYTTKPIPKDPWGNEYEYRSPGENGLGFTIRSLGSDGREGGEGNDADVCSW
jgi:general secretion pathway protein G